MQKVSRLLNRYPLQVFFGTMLVLFSLIIGSNYLRQPQAPKTMVSVAKKVTVYRIGTSPRLNLQAELEKSGIIQITAQAPGVISKISIKEGQIVKKGQRLFSMTTNYQGGNVATTSRQIVQTQYNNLVDNYASQKEVIDKQKEMANLNLSNADKLREIGSQSVNDTQSLIDLNNNIINTLNTNLSGTTDPALTLSIKQLKSQFQSANLQLNNNLRQAQYQSDTNNPPQKLANLQKDVTIKQLELQEKALELNREITKLQLRLAQINESLMYPAAPFAARVEKIYPRLGQLINPGQPLAILSASDPDLTATVYVPQDIANRLSNLEPAKFTFQGETISAFPQHISAEAVSGNLYSIVYLLPFSYYERATDRSNIPVSLPLGYPDTSATAPYIPLDAIYQTQESAYIFVVENQKAVGREVTMGSVWGQLVEITAGLKSGDEVILDRNVIAGDLVETL